MRVVIQRVSQSSVLIDGKELRTSGKGLLVFAGIHPEDSEQDSEWTASKIAGMRIFSDPGGKMNLSVNQIKGDILIISQFTLFASTKKGNRPSFNGSAPPEIAIPLYEDFVKRLQNKIEGQVVCGKFGADMQVNLINDGPVTITMDSKERE